MEPVVVARPPPPPPPLPAFPLRMQWVDHDPLYPVARWTCPICDTEYTLTRARVSEVEAANATDLGHFHQKICKACVPRWVKAKLDENCTEFSCISCPEKLTLIGMKRSGLIPKELLSRWENTILMNCLHAMPDLRYCPVCQDPAFLSPGCAEAQCPSCEYEFCPTCMLSKHSAIRCSAAVFEQDPEVQKRFFEERLCAKWKKDNTQPCPNCKAPIQKNDGCSHMTCKACAFEFCWICRQKYQGRYVTGAAANGSQCPCPKPQPAPTVPTGAPGAPAAPAPAPAAAAAEGQRR